MFLIVLERLATSEAGFDVVPPFDVVAFVGFPTEKYNTAVAHAGKVNQAVTVVFQLNTKGFQFAGAE
jgi:hypothetical protein